MFRIHCMTCCLFAVLLCASPGSASNRTLTNDRGKPVVLSTTESPDFFRYLNPRFGFTVDVPAIYTLAVVIPDNDDGVILSDSRDETRFRASGGNVIDERTLRQRYESDRKDLGEAVSYSHLGKGFYVLSWVEDAMIHYRKFLLAPSVFCDMEFIYPAARKAEFDAPVARSARSLRILP